mgnify:CR=1 FL=1
MGRTLNGGHSISSDFSAFQFNEEMRDFFKEEFKGKKQDDMESVSNNNPGSSSRIHSNMNIQIRKSFCFPKNYRKQGLWQ